MDDYTANIFTTGILGLGQGQTASGSIETKYDKDWFKIFLDGGSKYEFELSGLLSLKSGYEMLNIYDGNGKLKAGGFDRSSIDGPLVQFKPESSEYYYVNVQDLFDAVGSYTVSAKLISQQPSTAEFLQQKFNISIQDAGAWVFSNLDKPKGLCCTKPVR